MRKSNYDKFPFVQVPGFESECWIGWEDIFIQIKSEISRKKLSKIVICLELYSGVFEEILLEKIRLFLNPKLLFDTRKFFKNPAEIDSLVAPYLGGDDPVFGYMSKLSIEDFLDTQKLCEFQSEIADHTSGIIVVCGTGSLVACPQSDVIIYADLARWEAQLRQRRNEISNLGVENRTLKASLQYKRSFFVDWRVCDKLKRKTMDKWDYVLDTNIPENPKMISGKAMLSGLKITSQAPFRVVPFFDPGPWGGQWMKEVCDLDRSAQNYAWCFDCVPEENSLLLRFGENRVEIPSINLVFHEPVSLLGEAVYGRFGAEFPIRFDFLDTMGGGNLSFQVHPLTDYAQEQFGIHYTQDESYYMLDAGSDACVYLGRKNDADYDEMIAALERAQKNGEPFDDTRYVAKWNARKHDHFLIPAGTLHCSGSNAMVLEISATPYIFTFKLWDWGRMGLDGKPRPIYIDHGKNVIQWNRDERYVKNNLINTITPIASGDGWREERTGLHEAEFIETRRHWFSKKVSHHTSGGVNVLNLVEGDEVVVESPENKFEPFIVHYAETFIVPASVGAYTIRPHGEVNKEYATMKAFVRTNA